MFHYLASSVLRSDAFGSWASWPHSMMRDNFSLGYLKASIWAVLQDAHTVRSIHCLHCSVLQLSLFSNTSTKWIGKNDQDSFADNQESKYFLSPSIQRNRTMLFSQYFTCKRKKPWSGWETICLPLTCQCRNMIWCDLCEWSSVQEYIRGRVVQRTHAYCFVVNFLSSVVLRLPSLLRSGTFTVYL